MRSPPAACTIISKNYVALAKVLARSFCARHPDSRFFVLLVDRLDAAHGRSIDGMTDLEDEPFTLVEAEELEVPDLPSFLFKYSLLEANTAIKPFFLQHLFEHHDVDILFYFDPDILVLESLDGLCQLLDSSNVLLTPHLTEPIEDQAFPGELTILQAGAYNLGFIGLLRGAETDRLLTWWQQRLYEQCVVRIEQGLFVDQKWMDLAPGLFSGVHIVKDPGYNVAYWNLHGRTVELVPDSERPLRATANGRPLVFFHFSGIQLEVPDGVSKHQTRFTLEDLGDAAHLFASYRSLLVANGHRTTQLLPYAFGFFDNGVEIPEIARRLFFDLPPAQRQRFANPFATGPGSFFEWLNQPPRAAKRLSRLLRELYDTRADLIAMYPDVDAADWPDFCSWLFEYGRYEFQLDDAFLVGLEQHSRSPQFTRSGIARRVRRRAKRVYHSTIGRKVRAGVTKALGPERSAALEKRFRPRPASQSGPASWRAGLPADLEPCGVNIIGYLEAETGMGEAARSLAHAARVAAIPYTLRSIDLHVLARSEDRSAESLAGAASTALQDVNLLVVNADQIPFVVDALGPEVLGGRYNIGFWLWELDRFPAAWDSSFEPLREVWTPSDFCLDAISARSPIPVRKLQLPVVAEAAGPLDREALGIPVDTFLFAFVFNYLSYVERKNPAAVVRAFRAAFGHRHDVHLVLKTSQPEFAAAEAASLRQLCEPHNISLVEDYWSREQMNSLTASTDCYVSLHRSEGFGFTIAQAMAAGKPVIATPYSGVSEFFGYNTGFPVAYEVEHLRADAGPYPAGARWAAPDESDAADLMRRVVADPTWRRQRAGRGQEYVERQFSASAVGERMQILLNTVRRRTQGWPPRLAPF